MKVVIQRVQQASVSVENQVIGKIQRGLLLLVGFGKNDTVQMLEKVAKKCVELRIFEDEEGKMNRSLLECNGQILCVSQFTLYGDTKKGRRPSFAKAASPMDAKELYEKFCCILKESNCIVETGKFQADMQVSLINDGPVTICIDSDDWSE